MPDAAKLTLLVLKHAPRSRDFLARFRRWMEVVRTLLEHPNGPDALCLLLRYIHEVSEHVRLAELEQFIAVEAGNSGMKRMATIAQQLREEAHREMLLRLLKIRFGDLPLDAIERIRSANGEQLLRWSERVLTVPTLEEVMES
jgi:Domain of unknown function (DUF4351)